MAKATLPVNFQDDIMGSSMAGKRRYNMIQNSDGTVSFEDVTDYTKVGSNFGAAQINQTNKAVNDSADKAKIIDDLDDISANTQAGMIAGALAVRQLNSKTENGIVTATSQANGTAIIPITFKKRFSSVPTFVFSIYTSQLARDRFAIKSVTEEKAEVAVYSDTTAHSIVIHWIATI